MISNSLRTTSILIASLTFSAFAQASTFVVDKSKSSVEIDVKATGDSFTGRLTEFTASIQGNKATKKPSTVSFSWNFANLETGKAKRNTKMLSWLANGNDGKFVLKSFTKRSDGRMWAKGNMTINKKTTVVEFPCKVLARGNNMVLRGNATIDTRKFDLPIIKMMGFLTVQPLVEVRFTLRGTVK